MDQGDGTCTVADPGNAGHRGLVLGLVVAATAAGASATYQRDGAITGVTGAFSARDALFIGDGYGGRRLGSVVSTPPDPTRAAWIQQVGTAASGSVVTGLLDTPYALDSAAIVVALPATVAPGSGGLRAVRDSDASGLTVDLGAGGTPLLPDALAARRLGARPTSAELAAGASAQPGRAVPAVEDVPGIAAFAPNAAGTGSLPRPRIARTIPRDKPLSPFWFIDPQREYDIRNRMDTALGRADCAPDLQNALSSGENIDLGDGRYCVTRTLALTRQGQVLRGNSRFAYRGGRFGASIAVSKGQAGVPDFDFAWPSVVQLTSESEVGDLCVEFYQPPNAAALSDIIQYPPAFDISYGSRCRLFDVRVERGWTGIYGDTIAGGERSGGAWRIRGAELGCFNTPFVLNDLGGDFLFMDEVHCWNFGMTESAGLTGIYMANQPTAFLLNQDGGSYGRIVMWKANLVCNNTSQLPTHIGLLQLDNGARLQFAGGRWDVDNVLTQNDDLSIANVWISAGDVQIGNGDFAHNGDSANPMLLVTGGSCAVSNPVFRQYANPNGGAYGSTPHAVVSAPANGPVCSLTLMAPRHKGVAGVARTRPMIEQVGNGRLTVIGGRPDDAAGGSGLYIRTQTDDQHMVANNTFVGWGLSRKGAPAFATFANNSGVGSTVTT